MDPKDCHCMNEAFEELPWFIDARQVSLCNRPRLYWTSWELLSSEGAELWWGSDGRLPLQGEVELVAEVGDCLFGRWLGQVQHQAPTHLHYVKAFPPSSPKPRWAQRLSSP